MKIFEICEQLHMAVTGAGDPIDPDQARTMVEFLEARLMNWRPSLTVDSTHYDDAVRILIRAVLDECDPSWFPQDP